MEVKLAFKQALMSIPEGSTSYWLVKRMGRQGKPQKVDNIAANTDVDVYEEILLKHGPGEYLVWLLDNNDKKLIELPIRFTIPGEGDEEEEDDDREDEEEESVEDLRKQMIKKIKNDLEFDELLSLRSRFSGNEKKTESNEKSDMHTQRYFYDMEKKFEERERRLEEKFNAIISQMNSQNQQGGIYALIVEMQKSSSETTRLMMSQQIESNKMMMQLQSENQKTLMAIMNKPEKNIWDSPFFLEIYKKSTEQPKSFLDDSVPKMFDFMLQSNQQTMKKIMDMQFELGQNDIFFQRMKAFQGMFVEIAPHFKDLWVKLASIKAMKEVEKGKQTAPNTQQPQPQPAPAPPPQPAPQPKYNNAQPQPAPQPQAPNVHYQPRKPRIIPARQTQQNQASQQSGQPAPQQLSEEDLWLFFTGIYERLINGEDTNKIEQEIRNTPGALQQIKTNERLKIFIASEGDNKIKELFERLQNERFAKTG